MGVSEWRHWISRFGALSAGYADQEGEMADIDDAHIYQAVMITDPWY